MRMAAIFIFAFTMISAAAYTPAGAADKKNLKTLGVEVGSLAPEFSFQDAAGKWVSLSDFRGKKVFLFSWATWCRCKEQLPDLEKFNREFKSDKFAVIAVASDSQGFKWVKPYLDRARATFVALVDPGNELARKYNFIATENGFLIDEGGVIRMSEIGFDIRKPEQREKLVKLIRTDFKAESKKDQKQPIADRIKNLEAAVAENPKYLTKIFELSELYSQQGDFKKAETVLRGAVKVKKTSAEAHYRLGVALYQQGMIEEAVGEWERAFKYEPTNYIYMRNIEAYRDPEKFYSEISDGK